MNLSSQYHNLAVGTSIKNVNIGVRSKVMFVPGFPLNGGDVANVPAFQSLPLRPNGNKFWWMLDVAHGVQVATGDKKSNNVSKLGARAVG